LGVDPCDIQKVDPASGASGANQEEKKPELATKECIKSVDPAKRSDELSRVAKALAQSPLKTIYLIAGNNDIANEDPGTLSLEYFNRFIEDLQNRLDTGKSGVQLHNLTACYTQGGGPNGCYADVDKRYRLIGFPSYSFKNKPHSAANDHQQSEQLDTFRLLVDQARLAHKRVLVLEHIPDLDDPFALAQDRYDAKPPEPNDDPGPQNPRAPWAAWNVAAELLDGWKAIVRSDTVAAVFAGHFHDSHKEIYRRPYTWSTPPDPIEFQKTFLAPPLAVKNQDTSPAQARGFTLVTVQSNIVQASIYWYNPATGEFLPDPSAASRHVSR
jgi:hypothetical protein